jgi:hypothetical protein
MFGEETQTIELYSRFVVQYITVNGLKHHHKGVVEVDTRYSDVAF